MLTITRIRGDNYPVQAIVRINGTPADLTGSSLVFGYKLQRSYSTPKTIVGTLLDAPNGLVEFAPAIDDFIVAGTYDFDIQRIINGIVTTHALGTLVLQSDVSI